MQTPTLKKSLAILTCTYTHTSSIHFISCTVYFYVLISCIMIIMENLNLINKQHHNILVHENNKKQRAGIMYLLYM